MIDSCPQRLGFMLALIVSVGTVSAQAPEESTAQPDILAELDQVAGTADSPAISSPPSTDGSDPPAADESAPKNELETIPVNLSPEPKKALAKEEKAESSRRIEEIVVTANKRAESIRDIAGSVGAVRGDDLEKQGAKDLEGFLKFVPGVSLNKQDLGGNAPSIRGIASSTTLGISQAATGTYIDEVPLNGPYASFHTVDPNPYDLERVEVLKGPQATLYGSNSLAGAIRYILQKPKMGVWEGKATVDSIAITDAGRALSGEAAVNIPIYEDQAALRIAGVARHTPGYIDDLSGDKHIIDANKGSQYQGRILAAWAPNNIPLHVNLTYLKQKSRQDELGFADQPVRLERSNTPTPGSINDSFDLANLTAKYDFSWVSLLSSTSSGHKRLDLEGDGSRALGTQGQTLTTTAIPTQTHESSFSQEFRLSSPEDSDSPWSWIGGLWYTKYKNFLFLGIHQAVNVGPVQITLPTFPGVGSLDVFNQYTSSKGNEYAVFGDVTRTFWDDWTVTVGARAYKVVLNSNSVLNGLLTVAETQSFTTTSDATLAQKGLSPKATLKYQATDNISVYALVSRGFRFGGNQFLNPPAIFNSGSTIPTSYKSDVIWNYEAGTRTEWFDRALTLDATVFYLNWKNVQIQRAATGGLYNYVDNVGAAVSRGLELSTSVIPFAGTAFEGITFSSSAAFIDAVTKVPFPAGTQTVPTGTRLPGTPKFQISNVLAYAGQFGNWTPALSVTHAYIGSSPSNIFGSVQIGGYNTYDFGLRLGYTASSFNPTLSFSVVNAFDKRALAGATADPAAQYKDYYFIRPRALQVSLSAQFD